MGLKTTQMQVRYDINTLSRPLVSTKLNKIIFELQCFLSTIGELSFYSIYAIEEF